MKTMSNGGGYQLDAAHAPPDKLHAELRTLIASSRQRLGNQLVQEFGRGFEAKNLRRMVQIAQPLPMPEIVATLSRQLR